MISIELTDDETGWVHGVDAEESYEDAGLPTEEKD